MRKEYPLTAAQNMHYQWIKEYKTQQVSGVSSVAALRSPLDFGLLKKCIQLEIERYGCLRLRFTKPQADGEIKQYIVSRDPRDIPMKDAFPRGSGVFFPGLHVPPRRAGRYV